MSEPGVCDNGREGIVVLVVTRGTGSESAALPHAVAPPSSLAFQIYLQILAGQELPDFAEFAEKVEVHRIRPGHVLFDIGDAHPYVYLVRNGTLKVSSAGPDGGEGIVAFCRSADMLASLLALNPSGIQRLVGMPGNLVKLKALEGLGRSETRATAIQGCEVERVEFSVLEDLMSRHPAWAIAVFNAVAVHAAVKERREREFLLLTAEERYRRFLDDYNDLLGLVTQKDIASYVGVTPVGLNRIAKRVGLG